MQNMVTINMIDRIDFDYLKQLDNLGKHFNLLEVGEKWYMSDDTMQAVAVILNENGKFKTPADAISFFCNPDRWEAAIYDLINNYKA